jgi:phosphoglycerate dehydrogenase-like enzyme
MPRTTIPSRVVLITAPIEAHWLKRLQNLSEDLHIEQRSPSSRAAIPASLWQIVEILYTSFATPLPPPEQAPLLRWVQLYSAGPDPVVSHPLFRSQVTFTTASGIHATNMAEYVLAMVLAWFHQLPQLLTWQRQGQWPSNSERSSLLIPEDLRGKTIGIVGYGSIGRHIARVASAFGMHVLAMKRSAQRSDSGFQFPDVGDPEGVLPDRYYTPDQLHAMLNESDIVVIAVPLTPQTHELFDEAAFQAMKSTAFLVNIARGGVCKETALIDALEQQRIAGAALDVFHQEPLPSDHPLWHLPNTFISPHIAGLTPDYSERTAMIFEENLHHYLAGEPLSNVVDKTQGY